MSIESTAEILKSLEVLLPQHVGRMYSYYVGMIVSCIVMTLLAPVTIEQRRKVKDASSDLERTGWIISLSLTVILGSYLFSSVSDIVYTYQNVSKNKQHLTNIFWLKKYAEAFRSTPLSTLTG